MSSDSAKRNYVKGLPLKFVKDPISFYQDVNFGEDDIGYDITFYGATSGAYMQWNEGDDKLAFIGGAVMGLGVSGTELSYTAGSPIFTLYATNAGQSGTTSAEPLYVYSALTGAGQVGGRSRFHTYSNVASGGWVNAIKGLMEFGASGSASGLGSAICAETELSAGTSSGTYCALEGELVLGSGASTGTDTSFIYLNTSGAGASTFDTNGYLFQIGTGITPASGKFVSANSHTIKCKIEANTRYMFMSQIENGLGIGASGSAVSFSQGSPLMAMYATCSDNSGSSIVPWYFESTLTGAGGTGGRAHFYMTTNVGLGSWSNAIKGEVVYGASGYTTGLGSAILAELQLSAGTTQGNYAPLEVELGCDTGASTGTKTALMYLSVYGTAVGTLDDNAYLFTLAGVTGGDGHLFDDNMSEDTSPAINATLKINIGGTDWWIPLSDTKDCS